MVERGQTNDPISLTIPKEGAELRILVENMGRINYGPYLKDYKGITEGVRLGFQFLYHWTVHPLPLKNLSDLQFQAVSEQTIPSFYKGTFDITEAADTFLQLEGWTKGVVFINGFTLGRYWERGPQKTLYVPGPLLKEGKNEIILFELHGTKERSVTMIDHAILGE